MRLYQKYNGSLLFYQWNRFFNSSFYYAISFIKQNKNLYFRFQESEYDESLCKKNCKFSRD